MSSCDARAATHHIAARTRWWATASARPSQGLDVLGLYWQERAKPKACSTIHDAHGRHGQQCQEGLQRAMKIAWECMPSIHFKKDRLSCVLVWFAIAVCFPSLMFTYALLWSTTPLLLCDWDCSPIKLYRKKCKNKQKKRIWIIFFFQHGHFQSLSGKWRPWSWTLVINLGCFG